ncbi:uncharacterized protein LOC105197598 [Solenopsis invicta]|uniref:uncharacterized protein LOC105197598 n=1 Tax=Solenopsis invicta TaxID=13686 RepID=UPI0005959BE5|nr:uncharacterized protein LOC105197598 [Solenopsis invicta]
MQQIIDDEVRAEAAGVIEPSTSAWSFLVVVVRKRDGKPRFCIDFRKGYWQVPLSSESPSVTVFTVPGRGLMQFTFGKSDIYGTPTTLSRSIPTPTGGPAKAKP